MGINDIPADCSTKSRTHNNPGVRGNSICEVSVFNSKTNKLVGVANSGQTPTNISGLISQGPRPLPQAGIKKASIAICVPKPSPGAIRAQASVQTRPPVPPRTDVHKQASVQTPPPVPPRTDVHKQASVQTPPPVPPRTDVHKQASVQTPPPVPPRTDVHKQASVQTPPPVPPRTDVHGQAAVQNTPRPAPPGAEDLRRSELKREVLLQPETKVMSNPKSHVAKNATIQAENVAKVKNDVVKKNSVPEKNHLRIKSCNFLVFTTARMPC